MKRIMSGLIIIMWSSWSFAQTANYSTQTQILEIPNFTVDYGIAYKNVELIMNDNGESFSLSQFEKLPKIFNQQQFATLKMGESLSLTPELSLRFTHVLSDNRCPGDVVCITAGEVVVILKLTEATENGSIDTAIFGLSLAGGGNTVSDRMTQYLEIKGLYFNLAEVSPYPVSTEVIQDEDIEIILEYVAVPYPNLLVNPD